MSSVNNVVLVGRTGAAPELKNLQSGASVANVSLAVSRPTENKETDWFDIQFWGKTAEIAAKYVKKGTMIGITGRLRKETWEKEGEKRSRVVIVAGTLSLLSSKEDSNKAEQGSAKESQETKGDTQMDFFGADEGVNLG